MTIVGVTVTVGMDVLIQNEWQAFAIDDSLPHPKKQASKSIVVVVTLSTLLIVIKYR